MVKGITIKKRKGTESVTCTIVKYYNVLSNAYEWGVSVEHWRRPRSIAAKRLRSRLPLLEVQLLRRRLKPELVADLREFATKNNFIYSFIHN